MDERSWSETTLYTAVFILSLMIGQANLCKTQIVRSDDVQYIIPNEKDLEHEANCTSSEHKAMYLINTWRDRTMLVCYCDEELYGGICPEGNFGNKFRIQGNEKAPCHNFSSAPCPIKFNASESFKYPGCFVQYGRVPSQELVVKENGRLKDILKVKNDIIAGKDNTIKKHKIIMYVLIVLSIFGIGCVLYYLRKNRAFKCCESFAKRKDKMEHSEEDENRQDGDVGENIEFIIPVENPEESNTQIEMQNMKDENDKNSNNIQQGDNSEGKVYTKSDRTQQEDIDVEACTNLIDTYDSV